MSRWIRQYLSPDEYHAHRVGAALASGRTSVQNWEVLSIGVYGPALVLDGAIQSARGDECCYHEALHLPIQMARPHARRVLLIGGANGGSLPRVFALPDLEHVTLLDVDSELHAVSRDVLAHMHGTTLDDPRVRLRFGPPDAEVAALAEMGERYDLIVADTPDATAGSYSARLFAIERIGAIARLLAPDGLFVTQAGQAHPLACEFTARVRRTLEEAFAEVVLYTHHVPSFGLPWCFAVCGERARAVAALEPDAIDAHLSSLGLRPRAYDGETHRHMFALPRFLRDALADRARGAAPITLEKPEHVIVTD